TRAVTPRLAMAGPSLLTGLSGVIVRVSRMQILKNHNHGLFGRDEAADVYPIVLVASDKGTQPAQLASSGIFNGIFDGDDLPIAAPGFDVSRNLNAVPSFLDIHVLLMRSKQHQRDVAGAISKALQSDRASRRPQPSRRWLRGPTRL